MRKSASSVKKDPFIKWLLLGIPVLFIVAAPLHFLYDWSGKSLAVGLFTPVNESPWEHLKLTFWPILFWWIIGWLVFSRTKKGSFPMAAVTCAVCELACNLFILAFFYVHTGAFGTESLALDILSLFLGLIFGVILALHIYRHASPGAFAAFLSVIILLIMAFAFLRFTVSPPHIPLFQDPPTGTYGIRA